MTSKYLPQTVPGYFTGVYTSKLNEPFIYKTKLEQMAPNAFAEELKNVSNQLSKPITYVGQKVQNLPNCLPLTALVGAAVGPYGLIFAGSVLRLCQYYKKTSPPPRYY